MTAEELGRLYVFGTYAVLIRKVTEERKEHYEFVLYSLNVPVFSGRSIRFPRGRRIHLPEMGKYAREVYRQYMDGNLDSQLNSGTYLPGEEPGAI